MAPRTIVLKGNGIRKEAPAGAAITPGHLIQINSAGAAVVHATAAVATAPAYAMENELFGNGIDDDYAATDQVLFEVLPPGSEVYALLAAAATAVVVGSKLESAGDGTVRLLAAGVAIAEATEAVDNSGGGAPARIIISTI